MKNDGAYASYYRKSAAVIRIVRFAVLLAFVIFAVYCIGFFSSHLTEDTLKSVFNSFVRSFDDMTPSETKIKLDTDDSSSFLMMHNDLAVVSNTGTSLYAFSGDKMLDYDYTYSDAAAVSAGEYLLVYDVSGKELSLYNTVARIHSLKLDYDIKNASVNSMGYFAVISSEKTYRSGVMVYGPQRSGGDMNSLTGNGAYEEKFRWMSPDKYIIDIALNSNASELLCSAVYTRDGSYVTELVVYDVRTGEKKHTAELDDTLVLSVGYADNDGTVFALADGRLLSFNKSLEQKGSASYSRSNAKFFKEKQDCFIIAQSDNLSGKSMKVTVYDYNARQRALLETEDTVIDADVYGELLFVLYKDKLAVYELEENGACEIAGLELDYQYKAIRTDSSGRYVLIGAKNALRGTVENLMAQHEIK